MPCPASYSPPPSMSGLCSPGSGPLGLRQERQGEEYCVHVHVCESVACVYHRNTCGARGLDESSLPL